MSCVTEYYAGQGGDDTADDADDREQKRRDGECYVHNIQQREKYPLFNKGKHF